MAKFPLTPEILELIAHRFKALGDPSRLQILNAMRDGELTVTDIVERTGLSQANTSKQLKQLHALGFVSRRKEGLWVRYRLADKGVFKLCDVMCERVEAEASRRKRVLAGV
ncbi:MAG: metalloregulator ArsR/SmtB family transcription factor [Gemmatimonadaceae bacterium]|jgi:ArsR family transcriptional regulator|nr:metalloregulator ArsR/SmtB family transcription factor [Gemmatimonadaceae bacterium]